MKCQLWLMVLKIFHVSKGMSEGTISEQDQEKFRYDNIAFGGCILSILDGHLCDVYMHIEDDTECEI